MAKKKIKLAPSGSRTNSPSSNPSPANPSSGKLTKIHIIGPTASGKTTYLLALALLHKSQNPIHRTGIVSITPGPGHTTEFQQTEEIKWNSNTPLLPTRFEDNPTALPEYKFKIDIGRFRPQQIILNAKDYGGEFFPALLGSSNNPKLKNYLDNCLNSSKGCIIMLPDFIANSGNMGNREDIDSFYVDVLNRFINEARHRNSTDNLRFAVVMSKGERGELWPSRWEPERDLFKLRLSKTWELLRQRSRIPKNNISFFTLSSFGVLADQDARPNRYLYGIDGAILRETQNWNPFGLINPLYWIATGKKWKDPSF